MIKANLVRQDKKQLIYLKKSTCQAGHPELI